MTTIGATITFAARRIMRPALGFLRRRGLGAAVGFAVGALLVLAPALAGHHRSYTAAVTVAIWPGSRTTGIPDSVRMPFTAQVAEYMDTAPAQAVLQEHAAGLLGRPVTGGVSVVANPSLPFLTGTASGASPGEVHALLTAFSTWLPQALAGVPGAPPDATEAVVDPIATTTTVGTSLGAWLVIACALGTASAVSVAALREWLDDRVRTWARLRSLPLPALTEVSDRGRRERLVLSRVALLAAQLDLAGPTRRVVLVTSDRGRTGASSVAALLADAAADAPGHVHLVQPSDTEARPRSGAVVTHRVERLASPTSVARLLDRLRDTGGRVVVDLGPLTTNSAAYVVAARADDVLLVVGLEVSRLSGVTTLAHDLERRGIRLAGWVANHPARPPGWRTRWTRGADNPVAVPADVVLQGARRRLRDLAAGEG